MFWKLEQWIERQGHFVHSPIVKLTQSEQTLFQSTARVSRIAYYMAKNNKRFTNFESFIDLHEGNSINMGRVLHSKCR